MSKNRCPYLPNALEVLNQDYWGEEEDYLNDLEPGGSAGFRTGGTATTDRR